MIQPIIPIKLLFHYHKNYDNKVLIDKILAKLNELYLLIAIEAHNKTHIDN